MSIQRCLRLCKYGRLGLGPTTRWAKAQPTILAKTALRINLVILSLLISSCGFHLRGFIDMPAWLNDVAIILESANHDLGPMLTAQLEAYHIRVSNDPQNAHYWLIIEQDHEDQQLISVSSSTTPRQYQLLYTVQFKLQEAKGKVITAGRVTTSRQLTVNSNRILGSNDEENTLKHEMRRDAVIKIMNRIGRPTL